MLKIQSTNRILFVTVSVYSNNAHHSDSCIRIVMVLMVITFPISYPVALFLDCVIGHHGSGTYYRRSGETYNCNCACVIFSCSLLELRELVKLHGRLNDENEEPLTIDEIRVVKVNPMYICGANQHRYQNSRWECNCFTFHVGCPGICIAFYDLMTGILVYKCNKTCN